jgi:glutaredoxin
MPKYTKALRRWTRGEDDAIVVFQKPHCPYCRTAIQHLQTLNRPLIIVDVTTDSAYSECKQEMKAKTGHATYPCVFDAGTFVGGSEEALLLTARPCCEP